jgi:hypothetical protein
MVCFQKIGADHVYANINCQDYASIFKSGLDETVKLVTDGCGSCPHSEVGAILFHQILNQTKSTLSLPGTGMEFVIGSVFNKIDHCIPEHSDDFVLNNLLFTVLLVIERDTHWDVYYAGDGYILAQDNEDMIHNIQLDDGEYPQYWGYNLIQDKSKLCAYQEGVKLKYTNFLKSEFKNIGVASDGLRFVNQLKLDVDKTAFWKYLAEGREGKIRQLVNKNQLAFKDDLSIAF